MTVDKLQAAVADIAEHRGRLSADAMSSDLVYHPDGAHSFYRDLYARSDRDAQARLARHAEQMQHVRQARGRRDLRDLVDGGFEYRVEPNLTDGQGGYFSPPLWLNEMVATANRPGRVLADLVRASFTLPAGVSQIASPIIQTGTSTATQQATAGVSDTDIQDAQMVSAVVPITGQADIAVQLLELSPSPASADWAILTDLTESYDALVETQLLNGSGVGSNVQGIIGTVPTSNQVTYTAGSPTGSGLWPYMAQAFAHVGNNRDRPAQCWLMRTSRWAWLQGAEDTASRPFGISSPFFLGSTDDTPDPVGGLMGLPVFLDDAISSSLAVTGSPWTFGAGSQDIVLAVRPDDVAFFESALSTSIFREPLSGVVGVRVQLHGYIAALTGRRPAGFAAVGGTGLVLPAGFNS